MIRFSIWKQTGSLSWQSVCWDLSYIRRSDSVTKAIACWFSSLNLTTILGNLVILCSLSIAVMELIVPLPQRNFATYTRQPCVVSASASPPSENVFDSSYPRPPGFFSVELCSSCTVFLSLALGSASPPALPLAAVSRSFLATHNLINVS